LRFQQIAEELHIQFVILDDENRLRHPASPMTSCTPALGILESESTPDFVTTQS
jgi:hypothetical protein